MHVKKRRRTIKPRPEPVLFNVTFIKDLLENLRLHTNETYEIKQLGDCTWSFMGKTYERGFLRKRVCGVHSVKSFRALPEDIVPFADITSCTATVANEAFTRVGDRVTIEGQPGQVVDISKSFYTIALEDGDSSEGQRVIVNSGQFLRSFNVGQWVCVRLGKLSGRVGVVIEVDQRSLTVIDPATRETVRLSYNKKGILALK